MPNGQRLPGGSLPYRIPPSPTSFLLCLKPCLDGLTDIRERFSLGPALTQATRKAGTFDGDPTIGVLRQLHFEGQSWHGHLGRHARIVSGYSDPVDAR